MSAAPCEPEKPFIPSPCIGVCAVDGRAGLCVGCGRRLTEIGAWPRLDGVSRAGILEALPERLKALGDLARGRDEAEAKIAEALALIRSG